MIRDSETGLLQYHGTFWRSPVMPRVIQIANFAFGVLYALLTIRFVLEYVEARSVPFVAYVDRASNVFYRPFRGIVANGTDVAGHPLAWSLLIALVAYMMLHAFIVAVLRMGRVRDEL